MRKGFSISLCCLLSLTTFGWGFYAHHRINYYALFLLPPEMIVFYKPNVQFIVDHAVDPDKRRYMIAAEGPKHFIDLDLYGSFPYRNVPRRYDSAIAKYSEDTVLANGIVPWWIETMVARLTNAFKEKNPSQILKFSAEIGHYIADAHVPLHANSNHDGQHSNQKGIHAFWESRVPELLAETEFDFLIGKANYIAHLQQFIWTRVIESAMAADTVLSIEASLTRHFPADKKFAFEDRNGKTVRQYSTGFSVEYNKQLNGMIERRMRASIHSVASIWYTAWVNAGQPDLKNLQPTIFSKEDLQDFETLDATWKAGNIKGREH